MTETSATVVVVGVDNSDGAAEAVRWATEIAQRWSAPLQLVHLGHGAELPGWLQTLADRARERVAATVDVVAEEVCSFDGLPVADAADVLLCKGKDARLLVVGSHGQGAEGGLLAGVLADRVTREAVCPVAVVRDSVTEEGGRPGRVAAGIAGHDDDVVVDAGLDLAAAWGDTLLLVYAWSEVSARPGQRLHRDDDRDRLRSEATELLEGARARAADRRPDAEVRTQLTEDTALRALLDSSTGARALVVGPCGALPAEGMPLGSTTRGLVGFAACPVVVARSSGDIAAG